MLVTKMLFYTHNLLKQIELSKMLEFLGGLKIKANILCATVTVFTGRSCP